MSESCSYIFCSQGAFACSYVDPKLHGTLIAKSSVLCREPLRLLSHVKGKVVYGRVKQDTPDTMDEEENKDDRGSVQGDMEAGKLFFSTDFFWRHYRSNEDMTGRGSCTLQNCTDY